MLVGPVELTEKADQPIGGYRIVGANIENTEVAICAPGVVVAGEVRFGPDVDALVRCRARPLIKRGAA